MNLIETLIGNPEPGLVQDLLREAFDSIEVIGEGSGSIKIMCFDEERCRLTVRYWWTETMGWIYFILPHRRSPKRPYQRRGITYLPDGNYRINP